MRALRVGSASKAYLSMPGSGIATRDGPVPAYELVWGVVENVVAPADYPFARKREILTSIAGTIRIRPIERARPLEKTSTEVRVAGVISGTSERDWCPWCSDSRPRGFRSDRSLLARPR